MNAYEQIRSLPFPALASALGLDINRFKRHKSKNGLNYQGPCPVHAGKDGNSFSYCDNGMWHCFNCEAKGRGAIDLIKAIQKVGFKDAVAFLEPFKAHDSSSSVNTSQKISSQELKSELKPIDVSKDRKFARPCE